MAELSRAQIVVYAALAVAALMLGARWINSGGDAASASTENGFAASAAVEPGASADGEASFETTSGDLVVHVAGAVAKPGVYKMPAGSRVTDAIERAGGATRDAAPDAINLAAPLADGQQVQVPSAAPAAAAGGSAASVPGSTDGPISLSTATIEELDTIEGIGPVTAEDIIEFRDQGGVSSIDDLDQISGIGPATMEALRSSLQP